VKESNRNQLRQATLGYRRIACSPVPSSEHASVSVFELELWILAETSDRLRVTKNRGKNLIKGPPRRIGAGHPTALPSFGEGRQVRPLRGRGTNQSKCKNCPSFASLFFRLESQLFLRNVSPGCGLVLGAGVGRYAVQVQQANLVEAGLHCPHEFCCLPQQGREFVRQPRDTGTIF
jgi:hypothetical protein